MMVFVSCNTMSSVILCLFIFVFLIYVVGCCLQKDKKGGFREIHTQEPCGKDTKEGVD